MQEALMITGVFAGVTNIVSLFFVARGLLILILGKCKLRGNVLEGTPARMVGLLFVVLPILAFGLYGLLYESCKWGHSGPDPWENAITNVTGSSANGVIMLLAITLAYLWALSKTKAYKQNEAKSSPEHHVQPSQEKQVVNLSQVDALIERKEVDGLITALNDKNMDALYSIANALGEIGNEKAVDGLIAVLNDKNMDVRHHAAYALAKAGNARAVNPLITVLSDTTDYPVLKRPLQVSCTPTDARVAAAIALGKIGGEAAISALKSVTSSSKTKSAYHGLSVGEAVAKALDELGASDPKKEKEQNSEEPSKSTEKSPEEMITDIREQVMHEYENDSNHRFSAKDFSNADLSGLGLSRANFRNKIMRSTNLKRSALASANFLESDLTGANLSWTVLSDAILCDANLSNANLTSANLFRADLTGAKLSGATFSLADLDQATMPNGKRYSSGMDISIFGATGTPMDL